MNECECKKRLNINAAFIKAQAEFDTLEAMSTNPHFKSNYAKLGEIYSVVKPHLRKYDLFIRHDQFTHPVTHQQMISNIIEHAPSGERYVDMRYIISEKPGNQGLGAAETYMRRYGISSILGIAVGEEKDDDGEEERSYIEAKKAKVDKLQSIIKQSNLVAEYKEILSSFKVDNLNKLNDEQLFYAACMLVKPKE